MGSAQRTGGAAVRARRGTLQVVAIVAKIWVWVNDRFGCPILLDPDWVIPMRDMIRDLLGYDSDLMPAAKVCWHHLLAIFKKRIGKAGVKTI